jgi:hypothetical protein
VDGLFKHDVVEDGLLMVVVLNDFKVLHSTGFKEDAKELLALSLLANQEWIDVRPIGSTLSMIFNQSFLSPSSIESVSTVG